MYSSVKQLLRSIYGGDTESLYQDLSLREAREWNLLEFVV